MSGPEASNSDADVLFLPCWKTIGFPLLMEQQSKDSPIRIYFHILQEM